MKTPYFCDVHVLPAPDQLHTFVVPGRHCIQTNAYVAKQYGLDHDRIRLGSKLLVDEDKIGDYHQRNSEEEPSLVLEDYASFCSLLCAVDTHGNMAMMHAMLLAAPGHLTGSAFSAIKQFREKVDAVLKHPRMLVMSGANTTNINRVVAHIQETFADAERVVLQLSGNSLMTNALPAQQEGEIYSGMLFVPEQLSQTTKRMLLLITQRCTAGAMAQALS